MKLVICEKNIAARRIAYFLSNGAAKSGRFGRIPVYEFTKEGEPWKIIGLKGHILSLDYPSNYNQWNAIAPKELVSVEPIKKVTEKGIGSALKTLVDENPFVIVATDFDREGELIGVEAVELIKNYNQQLVNIKRAKFSSITKSDISKAFSDLEEVDYHLSNAGEARQIIDLVWGAVLTRFISLTSQRLGRDFLSIGRVQSPTLALLVEREKEIQSFEPKPYWKLLAELKKQEVFIATHEQGQIWDEQTAKTLHDKVKKATTATVTEVNVEQQKEYPPSPFNTTSFLQAASALGIAASRAMSIAEELYMSGLISYPRTDNTVYPPTLYLKGILEKLASSGGLTKEAAFVQQHKRRSPARGKKQATDHPPIHPVAVASKLAGEKAAVYELICRRFLATLCEDAVSETSNATFDINKETFKASGYRVLEPMWKQVYPYFKNNKPSLPHLSKDEIIPIEKITLKKDKTKPPKRYTQGSLLAKMESLMLGTKSTRHEIISKLYGRRYISGGNLIPTATGIAVVEALNDCHVVKPEMTAKLETDMDKIAEGKKTLDDTVKESRKMLTQVMKELEQEKERIKTSIQNAVKQQNHIGTCPSCGKDLVIRRSRNRKRFVGCSGYPNCRVTYPLPQKGAVIQTNQTCQTCKAPVIRVKSQGKRGWLLCLNPQCPSKNNNKEKKKED